MSGEAKRMKKRVGNVLCGWAHGGGNEQRGTGCVRSGVAPLSRENQKLIRTLPGTIVHVDRVLGECRNASNDLLIKLFTPLICFYSQSLIHI